MLIEITDVKMVIKTRLKRKFRSRNPENSAILSRNGCDRGVGDSEWMWFVWRDQGVCGTGFYV